MNRLAHTLVLLAVLGAPVLGADVPTAEEWAPVERALGEDAPDAAGRLEALVAAYPRWSDGRRTLAQVHLRSGRAEVALDQARQALALNAGDAAAAAVAVQALGQVQRPAEAFALAEQFVGEKDPLGWVNFRAAEVALNAGDRAKADLHLSLANGRAKKNPPAEFAYLDARISAAAGDLDRAELSLTRAVATSPRLWDAWYELGVVQLRQAESKTASTRREYLEKSAASFAKVTAVMTRDALAWLGLGRAQVTLAQDLLVDRPDEARALGAKAEGSLRSAIAIDDRLRDAHLNLGVALLMQDQHEPAITHLLRARDLGSTNRTLGFNLMLAYQKAGRAAEFEAEARNVQAVSTAEKLTAGIGFFRAGNPALAIELLTGAIDDLGGDTQRVAATHRFIGHAHAAIAESLRTSGADAATIDERLDLARDAWRKAGNLRDWPAQRFFMAQETARSPEAGYAAGWQHLTWHGYTSLDGWQAVIGNYGGAVTGGQGLAGMWARQPVHLIVWGVLVLLPLILGLIGLLRPRRAVDTPAEPLSDSVSRPPASRPAPAPVATRSSGGKPAASTTRPPAAPAKAQRTPAPAPATKPPATRPPATRPPSAKPVSPKPPVRSGVETEAAMTPVGGHALERKAEPRAKQVETEPTLRPAKAAEKQVRTSGEFAALERRTPRPEDGKKR
jgi:tetratricopeptide (TPR) repeat protein